MYFMKKQRLKEILSYFTQSPKESNSMEDSESISMPAAPVPGAMETSHPLEEIAANTSLKSPVTDNFFAMVHGMLMCFTGFLSKANFQ
jgi:hypothetical protein